MSIDWDIQLYKSVESTQSLVHALAQADLPEGPVVQALTQTGGRGRHGNHWESPIGNIYMSLLLRPTCGLERAGELAFVVAVALSAALDEYIDTKKHQKKLKWPNDILIDGLKISGILLESDIKDNQLNGIVVGMGVNVFHAPDLAINLEQVSSKPVYVNVVRDVILEKLSYYYSLWQEKGFEPIREKWLDQAYGIGDAMTARLPTESHKGIFKGLTPEGSLILENEAGEEQIIHAAEVHFGSEDLTSE